MGTHSAVQQAVFGPGPSGHPARHRRQRRKGEWRETDLVIPPIWLWLIRVAIVAVISGIVIGAYAMTVHQDYSGTARPAPHYGAAFRAGYTYAVKQIDIGNTPWTTGMSATAWCNANTGSYQYTAPAPDAYYHGCLAAIGRKNLFGLHPSAPPGSFKVN